MTNRITHKDVEIAGHTYRLKKMTPRAACWLFSMLAGRASAGGGSLVGALGHFSRSEFDTIQTEALKHVYRMDEAGGTAVEMPIISAANEVADAHLKEDAFAVFTLTTEVIGFNMGPFMDGLASRATADQPKA